LQRCFPSPKEGLGAVKIQAFFLRLLHSREGRETGEKGEEWKDKGSILGYSFCILVRFGLKGRI
jgi:hypothetical protein